MSRRFPAPASALLALLASAFLAASSPRATAQDGANDPTFNAADDGTYGDGANGPVTSFVLLPDGKALIAGNFVTYQDVLRQGITRVLADGRIDTSFNPGTGTALVNELALQPDGKVILVGGFATYNDVTRMGIARANANGSLDTSFTTGTGANFDIRAVALQPDGKIVIGGDFSTYAGTARSRIARLNANGSLDTSFNPGSGASTGSSVFDVVRQPDGKLLVGGSFTTFNGLARAGLARLNADGSVDTSFNPGSGANHIVTSIALQPDGKLLIAGLFTTYNGVARVRVARVNTDGSLDASFNPGTGANNNVDSMVLQPDGKALLAGMFTTYNGSARNYLVRVNADGSLDTSFAPVSGPGNRVLGAHVKPDGKVLIGGVFESYDGHVRKCVALVNSDGSLDASFNPSFGASNTVTAILPQADGKALIAGEFTSFNEFVCGRVARLHSDGTIDTSFAPGSGANAYVGHLARQPDGKVLLAGNFTAYGGVARVRVARVNADGSLDTSFDPGAGVNGFLSKLALQPDGKVLIAGDFLQYNSVARRSIARANADGSLDPSFDPGTGPNSGVGDIALQPEGKVLICGSFTTYNGVARNRIARLNADGSLDASFLLGSGANNFIRDIELLPDGKALICGEFTAYNGVARAGIARINADGTLDSGFNPGVGVSTSVSCIVRQIDGKLLIVSGSNLQRLTATGSLDSGFDPGTGGNDFIGCIASLSDGRALIGGMFTAYDGGVRHRMTRILGTAPLRAGPITGDTLCVGDSVSVPYTASFTYAAGNVFTAELSDATGSFAAPVAIGTLASTTSGTIAATVPGGTPLGNGYRIRVVSSDPTVVGVDNGTDLAATGISTWYEDADGDGFGDPSSSVSACLQPPGYVANALDGCPNDPSKIAPGICGCGVSDADSDGDGTANCLDGCPSDPDKIAPGVCGCDEPDVDSDGDGPLDCEDGCPNDPAKTAPGLCGCGVVDSTADGDGDGAADCIDGCPSDPNKTAVGQCGCGVADVDGDGDAVADCIDNCDTTSNPLQQDADFDGLGDACDNCPNHSNPGQQDCDDDSVGDACAIAGGAPDCNLNLVPDSCDIASGSSLDTNGNEIPDECEVQMLAFCLPGEGGVIPCPCANPPTSSGVGCNNNQVPSNGTGGAKLDGSGIPSIANDTLSLDVSASLRQVHVLFVGTKNNANVRTGAGVRCVGSGANGSGQNFLKRIAKVTPTSGPPSAFSFTGIRAASIAKGAPPIAGETYFYYVAYRNAAMNGAPGCAGLTFGFNATNAGAIAWEP